MNRGFLLDTNIPSEEILPRPEPRVSQWLFAQPEERLFLSAVTIGELRKGVVLLKVSKRKSELEQWLRNDLAPRFRDRILPVTRTIADRWGVMSASRQLAGIPLPVADGLIAATALEHGLTLVTRNTKDFVSLGVALFNPWED